MEDARIVHWHTPDEGPKSHEEIRANLLQLPNYVASPQFLRSTSWVASITQDTLRKASLSGIASFPISIIGVISSQNLYMNPHGNFSRESSSPDGQTTSIFAHAEYRFSLSPPMRYPALLEDFKKAIQHIRIIFNPVQTPKGEYSWEPDTPFFQTPLDRPLMATEDVPVFNLSFPIFHRSISILRNESRWEAFEKAIDPKYADLVKEAREDFQVRHLPIYRNGGSLIGIEDYHTAMEDALVEIQFGLYNVYGQGLSANPFRIFIIEQGRKE